MLAAVTAINRQIHTLAPVLNRPSVSEAIVVKPADTEVPVAHITKRLNGATYVFAAAMRSGATRAAFTLKDGSKASTVEVLEESRTLPLRKGEFSDDFKPYDVHLYRIADAP